VLFECTGVAASSSRIFVPRFFLFNSPRRRCPREYEANRRRAEDSIRAFFYIRNVPRRIPRSPARELARGCNDSSRIQSRRGDRPIPERGIATLASRDLQRGCGSKKNALAIETLCNIRDRAARHLPLTPLSLLA